jgi:hypothetical protein
MTNQQLKFNVFFLTLLCIIGIQAMSQVPHFVTVPNLHPGDSVAISHLVNNGTKLSKGKVIAWFPKDSLSTERMDQIADTLNIGVTAAESLIKAPLAWQVHQKDMPYTYYFRLDSFISHASDAGFVSIPFWRIKQGKAPWLHEALHEMLNTKAGNWISQSIPEEVWASNIPLWLSEGLPDYISMQVSQNLKLPLYNVFSNSFLTLNNIDSICKKDLEGSKADSILFFIGRKGALTALFGKERRLYAPTFYHCSCSFVKYLAESVGLDPLVASLAAYPKEMEELEKWLSMPIGKLKEKWLIKIKAR